MIRTQISLTEEQMRLLRAEARRRRIPIAAVVREAVEHVISEEHDARRRRFQRALDAAGRFHSGSGDLSARHDEIAAEGDW